MRAPKVQSYGAQPLVRAPRCDRMEHTPACTTGQVLLLVEHNYLDIGEEKFNELSTICQNFPTPIFSHARYHTFKDISCGNFSRAL